MIKYIRCKKNAVISTVLIVIMLCGAISLVVYALYSRRQGEIVTDAESQVTQTQPRALKRLLVTYVR
jgi:hypothetical protein